MGNIYLLLVEIITIYSCGMLTSSNFWSKYLLKKSNNHVTTQFFYVLSRALDAQSIFGGADLKPFYGLIDGGREGEFFKEMKQLFYYSQLRQ
jgi:hypothetical protein